DEYDAVFFGSSRVYRAFSPEVFAQELKKENGELRAFNFGVGHMRSHEMNVLIERVLAMKPKRLKYVFIEVMDWTPPILEGESGHERVIAWHTPRETLSACRTVWLTDAPLAEKLEQCRTHLLHFVAHHANYGGGTRWLALHWGRDPRFHQLLADFGKGDGFVPIDQEPGRRFQERREEFLTIDYERFAKEVAAIPAENARAGALDRFNLQAQLDQQRRIDEAGAIPIYVLPNLRWGTPDMNRLYRDGHLDHVLHYNHPLKYPALYDRGHYWDRGHLNREGARIFTTILADDFAAMLESGSGD
ncbi:MAG: hypothetical protein ACREJB_14220, partial [Planctomycetaceae bacterium]